MVPSAEVESESLFAALSRVVRKRPRLSGSREDRKR
jgi:hypothetical protein